MRHREHESTKFVNTRKKQKKRIRSLDRYICTEFCFNLLHWLKSGEKRYRTWIWQYSRHVFIERYIYLPMWVVGFECYYILVAPAFLMADSHDDVYELIQMANDGQGQPSTSAERDLTWAYVALICSGSSWDALREGLWTWGVTIYLSGNQRGRRWL